MRCVAFVLGLVAGLVLLAPNRAVSQSSDYTQLTSPASAQTWNLTLGAGLRRLPDYAGSNDYVYHPRPILSLGRGLKSEWWSAEDDALSIGFFSGRGWRVGFSGNLLWKRKAEINHALIGMPETKFGVEAGGFVEFYPTSWLRARADLRRGIVAHDSLVADFKLDVMMRIGQSWSIGAGPRMSIVGGDYVRTYFGAVPAVAGAGAPTPRTGTGLHSVGALVQATYHWTERFSTTAYAEYKHLVGDAARTPIVKIFGKRDTITLGVSASYAFDLGF